MILENTLSRNELKNFITTISKIDAKHPDMFTISSVFEESKIIIERIKVYGSVESNGEIEIAIDKALETFGELKKYSHPKLTGIASVLLKASESAPTLQQLCNDIKYVISLPIEEKVEEHDFDWGKYLSEENIIHYQNAQSDDSDQWSELSDDNATSLTNIGKIEKSPTGVSPETILVTHDLQFALRRDWDDYIIKRAQRQTNFSQLIQQPYWLETRQILQPNVTSHTSAIFSYACESFKEAARSCNKLTEYQVVREILWTLLAPAETYLFSVHNNEFYVQKGVTISSLSEKMFRSYLTDTFCIQLSYLRTLNNFTTSVMSTENNSACNTYKAYANAVLQFLQKVNQQVAQLEVEVKKQETVVTMIYISHKLSSVFDLLSILHHTHIKVVEDYKDKPNWFCALKLLSVLWRSVEVCQSIEGRKLLSEVLVQSLWTYFNIIESFVTTGKLYDPQSEFILYCNEDVSVLDEHYWSSSLVLHPYIDKLHEYNIEPLKILEDIINLMMYCGKSAELLGYLDLRCNNYKGASLYSLIVEQVTTADTENTKQHDNFPNSQCSETDLGCINYSLDQIVLSEDKYLMIEFEEDIIKQKKVDKTGKRVLNIEFTQPLQFILSRTVIPWLEQVHRESWLVMSEQLKNLKLFEHLSMLRRVYFFEAGDGMSMFCSKLFDMVEKQKSWHHEFVLNCLLEESLISNYSDLLRDFNISISEDSTVETLDRIQLEYLVPWPTKLILTKKHLQCYHDVFLFLLNLKWGSYSLETLHFKDLNNCDADLEVVQRMTLLRMWLLFFITCIHHYCMTTIMENTQCYMQQQLDSADNLDSIIKAHNEYVEAIHKRCLQHHTTSRMKVMILQVTKLALELSVLWRSGKANKHTLSTIERDYAQIHSAIACAMDIIFHYGADQQLGGLATALAHSCPHCIT